MKVSGTFYYQKRKNGSIANEAKRPLLRPCCGPCFGLANVLGPGGLILALLIPFVYQCEARPSDVDSQFFDALSSLQKAMRFYSLNFERVNLDSIFGVRCAEGALHQTITSAKFNSTKWEIVHKIKNLQSIASATANKAYVQLKASKSSYFMKFQDLINREWFFILPYQTADLQLVAERKVTLEHGKDKDFIDAATSDDCMTSLIGDGGSSHSERCHISDNCWNIMIDRRASGYTLTHQALYMALAQRQGCKRKILRKIGGKTQLQKHLKYLGSKIYLEMRQKYSNGFSADSFRDLFVEQVFVCQMLGIIECFDLRYLTLLIKWQEDSGCWNEPGKSDDKSDNKDNGEKENNEEGDDGEFDEEEYEKEDSNKSFPGEKLAGNGILEKRRISRKLQAEVILSDGCASHLTGVATGLIAMYIYWFFNPHDDLNPEEQFAVDSINFSSPESYGSVAFDAKWFVVLITVAVCLYLLRRFTRWRGLHLTRYLKFNI